MPLPAVAVLGPRMRSDTCILKFVFVRVCMHMCVFVLCARV